MYPYNQGCNKLERITMNIQIKEQHSTFTPDIKVNNRCLHINTKIQTYEGGGFDFHADSWSGFVKQVEVCVNPLCTAWRDKGQKDWENNYDLG
jgi:hypothetical protein